MRCKAPVGCDDVAIYRKMVLRCGTEFMCIDCLAEYLGVSRQAIEERIRFYRETGSCALFR